MTRQFPAGPRPSSECGRFRIAIVTWSERTDYHRGHHGALGLSTSIEFDTVMATPDRSGRRADTVAFQCGRPRF